MEIQVRRKPSDSFKTLSDVVVNGQFFCYGLEDPVREVVGQPVAEWKKQDITAIPAGKYKIAVNWSNRFKRSMPQVMNVPGFSGIRIHNGNGPLSTDGCLIVSPTPVFNYDRKAMLMLEGRITAALAEKEEVTIEYISNWQEPVAS